jgi:small subunit ribosomal protein S30e
MPSHGSITKAGKVRNQTPKIEPKGRKGKPPRVRNRVEYVVRVLNPPSSQKRGRFRRRR